MSVVVLILAAGESKRYGDVKQLADIDGQPMLRRVLLNLLAPEEYHVIVVLGANAEVIHPIIEDLDVTICANHQWEEGMSSSIKAGLEMIETEYAETTGLVIVLGDQWKLSRGEVDKLMESAKHSTDSIIATNYNGKPGVPVYFPKGEWADLKSLKGDEGAKQLLQRKPGIVLVDLPNAAFDLDER